jgi:hypothetical protein
MKEEEEDEESDEEWPWISMPRWSFTMKLLLFFARHIPRRVKRSTEAFVKKQCESDLDEIFSLNSIFLFGYKLYFYDNTWNQYQC